jgi:DoxX-like family
MQSPDIRLMRYSLAIVWIVTGILSFGIYPQQDSFALLARIGIEGSAASAALYLGSTANIVFGLMTLFAPSKTLWQVQAALVIIYTVVISIYLPEFWLHPFGPILKNIPFLTLLWLLCKHEGVTQ